MFYRFICVTINIVRSTFFVKAFAGICFALNLKIWYDTREGRERDAGDIITG